MSLGPEVCMRRGLALGELGRQTELLSKGLVCDPEKARLDPEGNGESSEDLGKWGWGCAMHSRKSSLFPLPFTMLSPPGSPLC